MRRRDFLAWGAAAGTAGVLGLWALLEEDPKPEPRPKRRLNQSFFDYARQNPEARQEFLSALFEAYKKRLPHCSGIVYDPGLAKMDSVIKRYKHDYGFESSEDAENLDRIIASVPNPIPIVGKHLENNIFVNYAFFDAGVVFKDGTRISAIGSIDEAVSLLVDHEGTHVEDAYEGVHLDNVHITHETISGPPYPRKFMIALKETRAYYNQLKRIRSYKSISDEFLESTVRSGAQAVADLSQYTNYPEFPIAERAAWIQLAKYSDVTLSPDGELTHVRFTFLK